MGVTPEGRPATDGGVGQFGDSASTVHPEYEAKPIDEVAPGVAVPNKPFEIRKALMKKPSNYDQARKLANPYPTVDAALAAGGERGHSDKPLDKCPECGSDNIANEGPPEDGELEVTCHDCSHQWVEPAEEEMHKKIENKYPAVAEAMKQDMNNMKGMNCEKYDDGKDQCLDAYPATKSAIGEEAGIVEDNEHLEKLGIESPDEFGVKFKGELEVMAEEHDLGDLLGYALTDYGIIIFGSDNVLKLDYDMEDPDVKPVYYFEQEADEEAAEPGAEVLEPLPMEEPPAEEPVEIEVEEPAAE